MPFLLIEKVKLRTEMIKSRMGIIDPEQQSQDLNSGAS